MATQTLQIALVRLNRIK